MDVKEKFTTNILNSNHFYNILNSITRQFNHKLWRTSLNPTPQLLLSKSVYPSPTQIINTFSVSARLFTYQALVKRGWVWERMCESSEVNKSAKWKRGWIKSSSTLFGCIIVSSSRQKGLSVSACVWVAWSGQKCAAVSEGGLQKSIGAQKDPSV